MLDKLITSRFVGYVVAYGAGRWRSTLKSAKYGLGRKTDLPYLLPGDDTTFYYYDLLLRERVEQTAEEIYEQVSFMRLEVQRLLKELSEGVELLSIDEKAEKLATAMTMKQQMDELVATLEGFK